MTSGNQSKKWTFAGASVWLVSVGKEDGMKSYGQFCPVAKAAEIFCERWTALIIRDLASTPLRFSELRRGVPLMSQTLLSTRLKQLEAEGIVTRRKGNAGKHWVYQLTPAGQEFAPLVAALGVWGQRWSRRELEEGEIDVGLLVWALEKDADPGAFGDRRTTLLVEFPDQPAHKRQWWFVNENGECQLCVQDPGFDVDLFVQVSVADLIYIWRGDLAYTAAVDAGRLELIGARRTVRAFRKWLAIAPIAHIESQRAGRQAAPSVTRDETAPH